MPHTGIRVTISKTRRKKNAVPPNMLVAVGGGRVCGVLGVLRLRRCWYGVCLISRNV